MNRELVSFCLLSYNQKNFFRQALEGAFAQTYSPLEIIIVDDGSTDGSQDMIARMIDEYRKTSGRHEVIFLQNQKNCGVIKSFERACFAARGCLVVEADGDDISYPRRVEKTYEAWVTNGRNAGVVYVGGDVVDDKMRVVGSIKGPTGFHPLGAVSAYSKRVFEVYGPIPDGVNAYQDLIWGIRAMTIGDSLFVPEKLIAYRIGGHSSDPFKMRASLDRSIMGGGYALNELRSSNIMNLQKKEDLVIQIERDQAYRENVKKRIFGKWSERCLLNTKHIVSREVLKGSPWPVIPFIRVLQCLSLCLEKDIGLFFFFRLRKIECCINCVI